MIFCYSYPNKLRPPLFDKERYLWKCLRFICYRSQFHSNLEEVGVREGFTEKLKFKQDLKDESQRQNQGGRSGGHISVQYRKELFSYDS